MDPEDLKKLAKDLQNPREGWSQSTGKSPMKEQLIMMKGLLIQLRGGFEKELVQKTKQLEGMMRHQVANDPRFRVKKS